MSTHERPPAALLPFPTPGARRGQGGNVLAVVGGPLDAAVTDLALTLTQGGLGRVDLLLVVEVPLAVPMAAYGEWLLAHGGATALDAAEQRCQDAPGEAEILLCRSTGPALAAEVQARGCSDLVLGMIPGGWWRRWRAQRAIAYVQARAQCRVYVIHEPPPSEELPLLHAAEG